MGEYDIRGGGQKITTIRFSDDQVINLDEDQQSVEIESEDGSTTNIHLLDFDNFINALNKAREIFLGGKITRSPYTGLDNRLDNIENCKQEEQEEGGSIEE